MKKKVLIIIISAASLLIIAAGVLFLTGVLEFPFSWFKKEEPVKNPELYVEYLDTCMLVDADDIVLGTAEEIPEEVPKVSGIPFSKIVVGEKIETIEGGEAYAYAKKIIAALKKNALSMREIYISSDLQATLFVNNVRILLGTDNKTEEKLNEMRDFFDDFKDLSGTLDMIELSKDNVGFTFRQE